MSNQLTLARSCQGELIHFAASGKVMQAMQRQSLTISLVLCLLIILSPAMAVQQPVGKVVFHEDWSSYLTDPLTPARITNVTDGTWKEEFSDNGAWMMAIPHTGDAETYSHTGKPANAPDSWNEKQVECLSCDDDYCYSVWLPFGDFGLNRIRHDFSKPYPTSGALECSLWVKDACNMRQRGITLILDTPSGKEASIAFGVWAGTSSPSYKVEGIRTGQSGYDDVVYHRLPEIKLSTANKWNKFVIDVGKSNSDKLSFHYSALGSNDSSAGTTQSLDLVHGKDYVGIKAIVVGALPYSIYTGSNDNGDHLFFVGDVLFSTQ